MSDVTEDVLARNLHLLDKQDDYWVSQRVSRGMNSDDRSPRSGNAPTVIVECQPLPLKARADPLSRRHRCLLPIGAPRGTGHAEPRAKTHNY